MPKRTIKEFERYIAIKAQYLSKRRDDIEDFQQEGRLAAWRAIQVDPNSTKSFVQQRIEWRMIDYARRVYNHEETGYTPAHENLLYGEGEYEENF